MKVSQVMATLGTFEFRLLNRINVLTQLIKGRDNEINFYRCQGVDSIIMFVVFSIENPGEVNTDPSTR